MIYIVIPVHNRKRFTRQCLVSLAHQTFKDFKVIIVDDGSTDGTRDMVESEFSEAVVLSGDGNLFWTAATNLGVQYALGLNARYVLTLNNDTILAPDFMEKMLFWAGRKKDALLGALELDAKTGNAIYGGEINDLTWGRYQHLLPLLKEHERVGLHEVTFFPGRGLLIPAEVFKRIGFFQERKFPHYMADCDFTLMARRKGFEIYCNYDAKLYSFPEECGDYEIRKHKSVRNYYNHLFSIKGGGNLRNFTLFTVRNVSPYFVPYQLIRGYLQRVFGYFLK